MNKLQKAGAIALSSMFIFAGLSPVCGQVKPPRKIKKNPSIEGAVTRKIKAAKVRPPRRTAPRTTAPSNKAASVTHPGTHVTPGEVTRFSTFANQANASSLRGNATMGTSYAQAQQARLDQALQQAQKLAQTKGGFLDLTNKQEREVFFSLQDSRLPQQERLDMTLRWLQAIFDGKKAWDFGSLLDFTHKEGIISWEEYEVWSRRPTVAVPILSTFSWNVLYDSVNKLLTWVQEEKQFWNTARINYQSPDQAVRVEVTRKTLQELSARLQKQLKRLEETIQSYHKLSVESLLEEIETLQAQIKQQAAQLEQLTQKANATYGGELAAEISQTQQVAQEAAHSLLLQNLQTQLEMTEQFAIHLTENAGEEPQARRLNPKKLTAQELKLYNNVQTASARLADWKKAHRGKTPSWDSTDPVEKALYNLISHVLSDAEKAGWGDTTLVQKLRKQSGLRKFSSSQKLLEEYKRFRVQNPHRNPNSNDPAEAKLHMAMKNQLNIHQAELETNPLLREMNRLWNTVPLEGEELIHLQAEVYARDAADDPVVMEAEGMWQEFLEHQQRGQ